MRQQIISYLVNNKGLTPAQAEGIAMNIADESSFNPAAVGDSGKSYGLFQHYGPRRDALFQYAGTNKPSWQQQIDFASTEPDWEDFIKATVGYKRPGKAAVEFLRRFERPAEKHARARAAKYLGSSPQTMETHSMTDPSMTWRRWDGPQGLHPQLEQLLAGQQQEASPWDALLGFGLGALSGGGGNWFGQGMAGAAQQMAAGQPQEMTALQVLQANNELYELEEGRKKRMFERRREDRQQKSKLALIKRLRDEDRHEEADLIEADLVTKEDIGGMFGFGGETAVPTAGTAANIEERLDPESGKRQYGYRRLMNDGTSKVEWLPPGQIPRFSTGYAEDVASARKRGELFGEDQAQAEISYPQIEQETTLALNTIDAMLADTSGQDRAVGIMSALGSMPGSQAADYEARFEQLRGMLFLKAYEQLKGGGQITEIEGQKAEAAMSRLRLSQSVGDHRAALKELREIMANSLERARKKAGIEAPKSTVPTNDPLELNQPSTNDPLGLR
jgi:hypothetical protein